jgi:hypothetical protein
MLRKVKASVTTLDIKSPEEITDDIFLEYGMDALYGEDTQVYDMGEIDEIIPSSLEAIQLARIGYDYPVKQDDFRTDREYFFFSKRNGGLVSLAKDKLLEYLKENLDIYELWDFLVDREYVELGEDDESI